MVGSGPNEGETLDCGSITYRRITDKYLAVFLRGRLVSMILQDQLADALAQAQEQQPRKNVFSSMSTDIRTPMDGIIGMDEYRLKNLGWQGKGRVMSEQNYGGLRTFELSLINEVLDVSPDRERKDQPQEEMCIFPA